MLQASRLRNNTIFEYQDEPYKVLSYKHTHMARGSADVRVKIKGLVSGNVLSCNFAPDEKFDEILLNRKKMQFLYTDESKIYLMDQESFSQYDFDISLVKDKLPFLKEGAILSVLFWEDKPLDIDLPKTIVFTVTEAEPGAKGNSAVNIFKTVTIDTGHTIKVPLFINQGDKIKVNTDRGEYVSRA